jgi:DNA-directed RNA polymerase specialized sigma24 family protein
MADVLGYRDESSYKLSAGINGDGDIDVFIVPAPADGQLSMDNCEVRPFSEITESAIRTAIGELAPDFRLIVILSLLERFSYREIADISNLKPESVRSRLHQGRRKMQKELFDRVGCSA